MSNISLYTDSKISLDTTISTTTSELALKSTTRPSLSADFPTTLQLVLMIGIPCLSLVICCGFCACCCCKCVALKAKMHQMGMLSGNEKKKKKNTIREAVTECALGPEIGHAAIPSFAVANHYMDIKQLAERNKKDYWELPPKNLIVHDDILGNGAFANVYKGTIVGKVPLLKAIQGAMVSEKDGRCEAAVKRLPAHADDQNRNDFFHEIDFMKRLGYHVHVIAMLGCVSDPNDPLIVVEYCHYGDLLRFLRNHRNNFLMNRDDDCPADVDLCLKMKDLVSFSWQISDGMNYLASKNFIHRDLAARNVLITKKLVAKISDFGLCRYIDSALYTAKGGRLPLKWMAIESLKFYEYSIKTDVWAFGVALFEIFSLGDGPYQAIQPLDMLNYLESGNRLPQPSTCPPAVYSLMKRCWDEDPNRRPTFEEIRMELTNMLNIEDEYYGYLKVNAVDEYLRVEHTKTSVVDLMAPANGTAPPLFPKLKEKKSEIVREGCAVNEDQILEILHEESDKYDVEAGTSKSPADSIRL